VKKGKEVNPILLLSCDFYLVSYIPLSPFKGGILLPPSSVFGLQQFKILKKHNKTKFYTILFFSGE